MALLRGGAKALLLAVTLPSNNFKYANVSSSLVVGECEIQFIGRPCEMSEHREGGRMEAQQSTRVDRARKPDSLTSRLSVVKYNCFDEIQLLRLNTNCFDITFLNQENTDNI